MNKRIAYLLCGLAILGCWSCESMNRQQQGAVIGAAAGGVVGGLIGNEAGNTAVGAILGAAIGGAAGAYIGDYMDKQAAEIERDIAGAKIERIGEGIKITFDSSLLYEVDQAVLNQKSQEELGQLATILNKYPDSNILLEGHTDATGSEAHNMNLSRQRAQSVSDYLIDQSVAPARVSIEGYGESQPIADNDTVEGRQANRRVEVAIWANEKLKKVAKKQTTQ
jgi:outer membrane protein OmpA-like peptidoglycan-associated protein